MTYVDEPQTHGSEDSYFVSMTDIMVGMVFVFIILLMYFVFRIQNTNEPSVPLSQHMTALMERDNALNELEKANSGIQDLETRGDNVLNLLQNAMVRIRELEAQNGSLKNRELDKYLARADLDRRQILESLRQKMDEADIHVQVIPDQGVLRLPENMLFKSAQSTIDASAQRKVKVLAAALQKVLPCFSLGPASNPNYACNPNATFIDAVLIEGHTDDVPFTRRVRAASLAGGPFQGAAGPVPPAADSEGTIRDNLDLSAHEIFFVGVGTISSQSRRARSDR